MSCSHRDVVIPHRRTVVPLCTPEVLKSMCCGGWRTLLQRSVRCQRSFPSSGRMAEQQDASYLVHTLYKPLDGVQPTAIIIFFHGLSRGPNEWEDTWLTRGPKQSQVCWPKAWLPKLFGGKVAVLAPSYDAGPRGVNDDVKEIGHNLRVSLIRTLRELADPDKPLPIILVGHSFGGLVIKSLICEAQYIVNQNVHNLMERRATADCRAFINNLKGAVFFSVPHSGTTEDFHKFWTQFSRGSGVRNKGRLAGIMKNLQASSRQMQQLTENFNNYVPEDISIFAFIEGKFMPGTKKLLVPEASAMQTARKSLYKVEGADHFEVCRPLREEDEVYKQFTEYLGVTVGSFSQSSTSTNANELGLLL